MSLKHTKALVRDSTMLKTIQKENLNNFKHKLKLQNTHNLVNLNLEEYCSSLHKAKLNK